MQRPLGQFGGQEVSETLSLFIAILSFWHPILFVLPFRRALPGTSSLVLSRPDEAAAYSPVGGGGGGYATPGSGYGVGVPGGGFAAPAFNAGYRQPTYPASVGVGVGVSVGGVQGAGYDASMFRVGVGVNGGQAWSEQATATSNDGVWSPGLPPEAQSMSISAHPHQVQQLQQAQGSNLVYSNFEGKVADEQGGGVVAVGSFRLSTHPTLLSVMCVLYAVLLVAWQSQWQ